MTGRAVLCVTLDRKPLLPSALWPGEIRLIPRPEQVNKGRPITPQPADKASHLDPSPGSPLFTLASHSQLTQDYD